MSAYDDQPTLDGTPSGVPRPKPRPAPDPPPRVYPPPVEVRVKADAGGSWLPALSVLRAEARAMETGEEAAVALPPGDPEFRGGTEALREEWAGLFEAFSGARGWLENLQAQVAYSRKESARRRIKALARDAAREG